MLAVEMLTEVVPISDVYVTELADIEDAGNGNVRFVFSVKQGSPYGGQEHVIKIRIVMPMDAVYLAIKDTMKFSGLACCGAARLSQRH